MTNLLDIGQQLVVRRLSLGLTQRELGQRLGVAQPQVARWESNRYRTASLERVGAVADALGYDVSGPALLAVAEESATYDAPLQGAHPDALAALARTGVAATAIAAFARSHGITRVEVFGSVLTPAFGSASDVDLLASYEPERAPSLLDLVDHETELRAIFRRPVDLVSRTAVESAANPIRKREILETARTLYARP